MMPEGPRATRKTNQQSGKINLRPKTNNPKETPKRPVAIVANPDTQGLSAQPVTRNVTNVVKKAIIVLSADPRHLVLAEVVTEVVPGQEDLEQNNLKKAVFGLDGFLQDNLNKIIWPTVDHAQDPPTYQRSDVVG